MNYREEVPVIQDKLRKQLKKSRYVHTLGVAYTASCLAMKHGEDPDKAIIAGLLHDCVKYMSGDEMYELALKYKLDISDAEKAKPDLLHAKLGSYTARKKYDIDDEDILSAIRYHTTGRPDMSLFEKIIYVADYIEPGRDKMPRLDIIRKTAFEDIDLCLRMILEDSVNYLNGSGMFIDSTTIETYNYYCK